MRDASWQAGTGRIRPPSRASRLSQPYAICAKARGVGGGGGSRGALVARARSRSGFPQPLQGAGQEGGEAWLKIFGEHGARRGGYRGEPLPLEPCKSPEQFLKFAVRDAEYSSTPSCSAPS